MRTFDIFVSPPPGSGKSHFSLRPKIAHHIGRKPLSFHSVSFGPDGDVPVLQRMADIARGVQENAQLPAAVSGPPSSFADALDTVRTYLC
jgi:hypothetical protein